MYVTEETKLDETLDRHCIGHIDVETLNALGKYLIQIPQ